MNTRPAISCKINQKDTAMLFFAISVFISAFLLFQIQPMIGRFILPWFGGTPAVWSTVMLFVCAQKLSGKK